MTEHSVLHHTFTIERSYPVSVATVFAAWGDPAAKKAWFAGGDPGHELDFRVGGREVNSNTVDGKKITFESRYLDIVDDERIAFSSRLSTDGVLATASITTVELRGGDDGTELVLTESDVFFDSQERPQWREAGTGNWLADLGAHVARATAG